MTESAGATGVRRGRSGRGAIGVPARGLAPPT